MCCICTITFTLNDRMYFSSSILDHYRDKYKNAVLMDSFAQKNYLPFSYRKSRSEIIHLTLFVW